MSSSDSKEEALILKDYKELLRDYSDYQQAHACCDHQARVGNALYDRVVQYWAKHRDGIQKLDSDYKALPDKHSCYEHLQKTSGFFAAFLSHSMKAHAR